MWGYGVVLENALQVTLEQVKYLAQLVHLRLGPDEELMASELSRIVAYMKTLDEVSVAEVPPLEQVPVAVSQLRTDLVRPGLWREEALALAPKTRAGFFSVPKVK